MSGEIALPIILPVGTYVHVPQNVNYVSLQT